MKPRQRQPGRRSSRGAGIVENMFALGLFSCGLAIVTSLTQEIAFTNELSQQIATATTLARNRFEDIRTRDPEERQTLGLSSGSAGPLNAAGDPSTAGRYSLTWQIQEEVPHAGLEKVTIRVFWIDPRGKQRRYEFSSGLRKGWPVPTVIPATDLTHGHGKGHTK